ncbi:MAG: cytochrome P450 [Alphaproteobacteria bacterium]|nr:MAG: cytochrome P450 [Alphaproteobacteria bacterium]
MKTVTVNEFDQIYDALRNPNLKQALYDEGKVIMDKVLLTLHGAEHRARRNLEFKVFRRNFFRYYQQEVFPPALEQTLAPYLEAGRADLIDFGYRVTINLTADFAGIDRVEKTPEETEDLLRFAKIFSEGATMVHSTRDKDVLRREVAEALIAFDERFVQRSIARRQKLLEKFDAGEISEDQLPRDVLTVILRNEDKVDLPPDVVLREMAFYLQAGSHSTSNSMVHAFHEITTWCADHPEDRDKIAADPLFLQRCVHESLRLHPASPESWRSAMCPMKLADGAKMETGDKVVLDLHQANRNKDIFGEDADRFNPYREIPKGRDPFGLTFGVGIHTCLGRDLDGGVVPKGEVDPETHEYGIVTLLVKALLDNNARPDPDDPPTPDPHTSRPNWGRYPVILG